MPRHLMDLTRAPRRALIANFGGIGNGFMILPLLGALERAAPWLSYFHVENPVLRVPEFLAAAGVSRLLGEVPTLWRRFAPADRPRIDRFIQENGIDLVMNLRNEDLAADARWQAFRADYRGRLETWELPEVMELDRHRHIADEIARLFARHDLPVDGYSRHFLRDGYRPAPRPGPVGFATASQKDVKCWPEPRWVELGALLLERPGMTLEVFAGTEPAELEAGARIAGVLSERHPGRVTLRQGFTLEGLARALSRLSLLVANDSGLTHLATALDLPAVGVYMSTDAEIWGGRSTRFTAVQSGFFHTCPERKPSAGNCRLYDAGCPAPCKDELTAARVLDACAPLLDLAA